MTQKRSSPGVGDTEARKITSAENDLPTTIADEGPTEYWIHVKEDGTEKKFRAEPIRLPSPRVHRLGDIERTWTRNYGGQAVEPRGSGWSRDLDFFDTTGCSTSWVRDRVKAVRS
jgi:hypothetical protein